MPFHLRTVAKETEEAGAIRSGIRSVRLALQEAVGPLRAFEECAVNAYETGKAHSACEHCYGFITLLPASIDYQHAS